MHIGSVLNSVVYIKGRTTICSLKTCVPLHSVQIMLITPCWLSQDGRKSFLGSFSGDEDVTKEIHSVQITLTTPCRLSQDGRKSFFGSFSGDEDVTKEIQLIVDQVKLAEKYIINVGGKRKEKWS